MVKQRFLTHFKPWLVAVIKVTGLIVAYQFFDQVRTYFQYASLSTANVVSGATALLLVIGLLCMITAWGEWCWFKLRGLRWFFRKLGQRSRAIRTAQAIEMLQPTTKRMF
jgi:Na+/melibiose symporter-like transporter